MKSSTRCLKAAAFAPCSNSVPCAVPSYSWLSFGLPAAWLKVASAPAAPSGSLREAESDVRGYVIGGDKNQLASYRRAVAQVEPGVQRFARQSASP